MSLLTTSPSLASALDRPTFLQLRAMLPDWVTTNPLFVRLTSYLAIVIPPSLSLPRLLLAALMSHYLLTRWVFRRILPFIAQRLIDQSDLVVESASIGELEKDKLVMSMKGKVTGAGPLPATITFTGPVKLCYEEPVEGGVSGKSARLVTFGETDTMPPIEARNGEAVLDSAMLVRVTNVAAFGAFSQRMMQSTTFHLVIVAEHLTVTSLGLPIKHVILRKRIMMKGLQNLSKITIRAATAVGGTHEAILLRTTCDIYNPSDMNMSMGDVSLHMIHEDEPVGIVIMDNMSLRPGNNTITATAKYCPQTLAAHKSGRRLLAQFVTGELSTVSIAGHQESTPFKYLLPALASMRVTTTLPGDGRKMILGTRLIIDPFRLAVKLQSATVLELFNPMDAPVTVLWMTGTVTCSGEVIGGIDEDLRKTKQTFVIPPNDSVTTGIMGMKLRVSPSAFAALIAAGRTQSNAPSENAQTSRKMKLFEVDVESTIGCLVGEYETVIDYSQEGVPVGL
ncbi:hypothetical protein BC832DRAFT_545994 [Gaertneriomyces semiglobifer]|nr:hypothetical protein BC832DRAFT_545994 [Gaertneriomyces semiglobifer]